MSYFSIDKHFVAETEEKRSRFIATLVPYSDFQTALAGLQNEHKKANHHVTAFRYFDDDGKLVELGKDDGEPSGTSGMPVLKTMIGAGLINAAIIVTRYFGGIKLGTGGLARAYAAAANTVIGSADMVPWEPVDTRLITASFENSSQLENKVAALGLGVVNREFTQDGVRLLIEGPKRVLDELDG